MRLRRVLATVAIAGSTVIALTPLDSSATLSRPTLTQLATYLKASVATTASMPSNTIPYEPWAALTNYGKIPYYCYTSDIKIGIPHQAQARCAFGDVTSPRRILVFGDENAVQWLPALSQLGTDLHWRIIFLGKPQCSAWSYLSWVGTRGCRTYMRAVVTFADALHARYVMPIGAKVAWRGNKDASVRELRDEMAAVIDAIRPSMSRILLMAAIPQFSPGYTNWTPSVCFQKFPNNLAICERVIHNFVVTNTASLATWRFGIARNLHMIPTEPLFCSGLRCALFVKTPQGTFLVYRDAWHMNRYYSNYIAVSLEGEMGKYLT